MFTRVFLTLSICFTAGLTYAQKTYKGGSIEFGRSQFASPQITGDDSDPSMGIGIQGFIQKPVAKQFNVKGGLAFQFLGDRYTDFRMELDDHTGDFEGLRYRFGYVSMPVTVQYHSKKRILQPYGSLGLVPSVLVFTHASAPDYTPCLIYTDTEFRRLQFNIQGEVGLQFQYKRKKRFSLALVGVHSLHDTVKSGPAKFYNRQLMFSVGHSVRL